MRIRLRSTLAAFALGVITCSESSTEPSGSKPSTLPGHVVLSVQFTPEALRAFTLLATSGLGATEIHVQLTPLNGSARDTVIPVPAFQDSIRVDIPTQLQAADQPFAALVELRNLGHTVLFSGTQAVVGRTASQSPIAAAALTINYNGPGKSVATISLTPPDTTLSGTSTVTYTASTLDAASKTVPDALIVWTSSDTSVVTVTSAGGMSAMARSTGKRGTVTLSASTPLGVAGKVKVSIVPLPTHLVVVDGGVQSGIVGGVLPRPMVIEVQAADNLPVPGTTVNFRAVSLGASVANASAIADTLGRVSTIMTLGRTAGVYQYEASSGAITPVTVTASARVGPPTGIVIVSGNSQLDSTGSTLAQPLVVKVTDEFGGPVSGQAVSWTLISGNGLLASAVTTTLGDGTASNGYTLGSVSGVDAVEASVSGVSGAASTVRFAATTVTRGVSSISIASGNQQNGFPQDALPTPLVARVADALGNPLQGIIVQWSAAAAGATFNPSAVTTGANGLASTIVTLGSAPGAVAITATASGRVATGRMTIARVPAFIGPIGGANQTATVGRPLPIAPSVLVTDAQGLPVYDAPVTFAVTSPGGSATGVTTITNAIGIATIGSWVIDTHVGTNTLTATSGAVSTTITATGIAGHSATIWASGLPVVTVGTNTDIWMQLADDYGNPTVDVGVVIYVSCLCPGSSTVRPMGTTTTFAQGGALFSPKIDSLGTSIFYFSAPGFLTSSFKLLAVNGNARGIWLTSFPHTGQVSGVPFSPPLILQVTDGMGNPVSESGHVITVVIDSGGGTFNGSASATTDAKGVATFTNLALIGAPGVHYLNFVSAGLSPPINNPVWLSAGPPSTLSIIAGANQSAAVGTAVAVPPAIRVTDNAGNPIVQMTVFIGVITGQNGNSFGTISYASQTGTSFTLTTDTLGIVRLTRWTLGTLAGPYGLYVGTSSPQIPTQYISAAGVAGPGTTLRFVTAPPAAVTSGAAFGPPIVLLTDAYDNPVLIPGTVVTASIASGTGTLSNATATTDAYGWATFTGLTITGTAGNVVLKFSAPGYPSLSSETIALH